MIMCELCAVDKDPQTFFSEDKSFIPAAFSGVAALNGLWDQADNYSVRKVWCANTGHLDFADFALFVQLTGFVGGLEMLTGTCTL